MLKTINILVIILISGLLFANNPHVKQNTITQIHTDRFCYVSGDKMFVKVYHYTGSTGEIAMYIDIVDANKQFICGEILKLENGIASGILSIPDTLKTGEYLLRTYTQQSKKRNCILQTKLLFVTNRFGANSQSQISNNADIPTKTDSLLYPKISKIVQLNLETNDSVFNKRTKVVASIELINNSQINMLSASLLVKPVSACEVHYFNLNRSTINKSGLNNATCADSIALKPSLNESKGLIVLGKVMHKITGNPLNNILILLAHQDSTINLKYAISDENGNFKFLLNSFYGRQTMHYSTYTYPKMAAYADAQLVINSKFITQKHKPILSNNKSYMVSTDSLNIKKAIVSKAYALTYHKKFEHVNPTINFEDKFLMGNNIKTTNIDDYVSLPDFYEIAKEILPFVRIRKKELKYVFYVNDGINNKVRANPLVIVDGIPLTNYNKLMNWGSNKIKTVQVQIEPRFFGDVVFENGIVLIWTRNCDFWETNRTGSNAFVMQGLQHPVKFSFPQYNKKSPLKTPDFRNVLYWEPDIEIKKGKVKKATFYTSDETGAFEIVLRGYTQSHKPFFIRKYIYVKNIVNEQNQ